MDSTLEGLTLVVRASAVGFDASLEQHGVAVASTTVAAWSDPVETGMRLVAWLKQLDAIPATASFIAGPDGPEPPPVLGPGWPVFGDGWSGAAFVGDGDEVATAESVRTDDALTAPVDHMAKRRGRRKIVLIVAAAAAVALVSGVGAFLATRENAENRPISTASTAPGSGPSTSTPLSIGTATGGNVRFMIDADTVWSSPAVAGDIVVAGHPDSKMVQAISITDGVVRWSQGIGPIVGRPIVSDGAVFFAGSVGLYSSADAMTGQPLWSQKIQGEPFGLPAITSDSIIVGTADGWVVSMDRSTGTIRWQLELSTQIRGSLVASDGMVFVGEAGGSLFALDAATGATKWSVRLGSTMVWGATLGKGSVTAVDSTGTVSSRNMADGSEIWTVALGGDVQADLASGGDIVAVRVGESLVGLAPNRGDQRWKVSLGGLGAAQPATDGRSVVVVGGRGDVICVEMSTGTARWSIPSTVNDAVGTPVFAGSDENLVVVPVGTQLQSLVVE